MDTIVDTIDDENVDKIKLLKHNNNKVIKNKRDIMK